MTAPDPRWAAEARRVAHEIGAWLTGEGGWCHDGRAHKHVVTEDEVVTEILHWLEPCLTRVAEEARTEAMMLLHEASQAKLDLNDMLKNAHAAGREEMREEAAKRLDQTAARNRAKLSGLDPETKRHSAYSIVWNMVDTLEHEAKAIRSLPTAKSAKPEDTQSLLARINAEGASEMDREPKPGGEALPLGHEFVHPEVWLGLESHGCRKEGCGQPASAHQAGGEK